jgi:hypothetical protein
MQAAFGCETPMERAATRWELRLRLRDSKVIGEGVTPSPIGLANR